MIKLLYKTNKQEGTKLQIHYGIQIFENKHDIYIKLDGQSLARDDRFVDHILPVLLILASKINCNIDLGGLSLYKESLAYFEALIGFYASDFSGFDYHAVSYENYELTESIQTEGRGTGLFFSGGVDSLYSYYENKEDIDYLLCVLGFDIHYDNKEFKQVAKMKFQDFADAQDKKICFIETNLREITEPYIHRDMIHGSCLGCIAGNIYSIIGLSHIFISSSVNVLDHKAGSDPRLDSLFSLGRFTITHFGAHISRSQKVQAFLKQTGREDVLRVCRENRGNKYNCGVCEKCSRTLLEFKLLDALPSLSSFSSITLTEYNFESIRIWLGNRGYYEDILSEYKTTKPQETFLISQLKNCIEKSHENKDFSRVKKKNILFLDFNGVLSYKNFWHTRKEQGRKDFSTIQSLLFIEHIDLVKQWMVGKKTSEDICLFLSDHCDASYEELLYTLQEDCESIDISIKILNIVEQLREHYHLVMITDNMDCFVRRTLPHNASLLGCFEHIRDSYSHKSNKKDQSGAAFLSLIHGLGAQKENCILIDDSKNNCRIFQELGGQSYCLNNEIEIINKLNEILATTQTKRIRQF